MRVAIVTGGARGIGAAIALRLAADGMSVGVVDLDEQGSARTAKEIKENGGRAIPIGADAPGGDRRGAGRVIAQTPVCPVSMFMAFGARDGTCFCHGARISRANSLRSS